MGSIDPREDISYTKWNKHGEKDEPSISTPKPINATTEFVDDTDFASDIPTYGPAKVEMVNATKDNFDEDDLVKFQELLLDAEKPLYEGCPDFTKLSAIVKLLKLKGKYGASDKFFTKLLGLLKKMLPAGNEMVEKTYQAKKVMKLMGSGYKKIHVCINNRLLYWKDDKDLTACQTCGISRWKIRSISEDLRWHTTWRITDGVLRHPADSQAWRTIDEKFPKITKDPRNARLGISADGVNVNTGNRHHKPLVDDLHTLFETWVDTYDASTKDNFNLHAVVLWKINDYHALGTLCGCPYNGFKGCVCGKGKQTNNKALENQEDTRGRGGKIQKKKRNTTEEEGSSSQVNGQNEKNVAKSLVETLLNVPGKTKDGVNARLDLAELGVKPKLFAMQKEDKTTLPPTCYTLTNAKKDIFYETLYNISVPQGYCSNFSSLVSLKDRKLIGLKSHDYHKLMQEFLPIAIRSIMHPTTQYAIIKFFFFKSICSKEIRWQELDKMQEELVVTLCILKKFFPLPEGCIDEETIAEETIEFFSEYHKSMENFGIPPDNHETDENEEGKPFSVGKSSKRITFLENEHSKSFAKWLRKEVERELAISKESVSETIRWISYGPRAIVVKYDAYNINGYIFRTKCHDGKVYQNSGVSVEAIVVLLKKSATTDIAFSIRFPKGFAKDMDYE
ncbi:hypothetical protein Tco_0846460 [Tanacetum coccineum]